MDDPPQPGKYGLQTGENAETYYRQLLRPAQSGNAGDRAERLPTSARDCGSGAHGERRPWELPDDDGSPGGTPGVDSVKAELVRRDVAQRILDRSGDAGDAPLEGTMIVIRNNDQPGVIGEIGATWPWTDNEKKVLRGGAWTTRSASPMRPSRTRCWPRPT